MVDRDQGRRRCPAAMTQTATDALVVVASLQAIDCTALRSRLVPMDLSRGQRPESAALLNSAAG